MIFDDELFSKRGASLKFLEFAPRLFPRFHFRLHPVHQVG